MNKLHVIQKSTTLDTYTKTLKPKSNREQTQARCEREWLKNPAQFNPLRNIREKERINRTDSFIRKHLNIRGLKVVDLGCGPGILAKKMRDAGAKVEAVDIAKNALEKLRDEKEITPVHACMPHTHLSDSSYDLVVCTELIASLSTREHRLFFNELARLCKRDSRIIFSTSVDIDSEDALDRLISLMQTELEIIDYQLSYHSRYIRLKKFFSMPRRFSAASKNAETREREIKKRYSIYAQWFKLNSTKMMGFFWLLISPLAHLIENWIDQNRFLLLFLEKLSHSEKSISHLIMIAKRKTLMFDTGN